MVNISDQLGRFVSPDILIPDPADPQSYNRYAYVLNNPLRLVDASGHFGEEIHRDLTYEVVYYAALYYGRAYGLEDDEAKALAADLAGAISDANQAVDNAIGPDSSLLPGTPHWYNHSQAADAAQQGVDNLDPEEFGRAMHGVQDYFSHFGQGFIGESGDAGEELYERLLAEDNHDTFATEDEWRERSRSWGHLTVPGATSWDDFDRDDSRCEEMVEETVMWAHRFVRAWFEDRYGPRIYHEWDSWRHMIE